MKHKTWLDIALSSSLDSKCVSMKVGCVLVKDNHIISTGINGTAKGDINCCEKFQDRCAEHSEWSAKFEIHSEMSAIIYCPVSTEGSVAYVTHSPCFNCCKHLIAAGVRSIYFLEKYYRMSKEDFQEIVDYCRHMSVGLIEANNTWVYHVIGPIEVQSLFTYRKDGLYWNERPRDEIGTLKSWSSWNGKHVGNRFGSLHGSHKTSYRRGTISSVGYLEHVLVWLYHKGEYPKFELDHEDGDGLNNSIDNLRDGSNGINSKNLPLRSDNQSGHHGIRQLPSGSWRVDINSEYQGCRKTLEDAIEFRKALEIEYGYHENHGR